VISIPSAFHLDLFVVLVGDSSKARKAPIAAGSLFLLAKTAGVTAWS
jgi:hypothetical protein